MIVPSVDQETGKCEWALRPTFGHSPPEALRPVHPKAGISRVKIVKTRLSRWTRELGMNRARPRSKEVHAMKKLVAVLTGLVAAASWLLPLIAEAKIAANHNETFLLDK